MVTDQQLIKEIKKLKFRAYKLTGNKADGDDLLQDVALKAFKYRSTLTSNNKLKNWLFVMMRNLYINTKKREGIIHLSLSDILEEIHPEESNQAEYSFSQKNLDDLITTLPESRQIVMKYHIDGFHLNEIVALTGKTLNTVKSDIHLSRKKISQLLRK